MRLRIVSWLVLGGMLVGPLVPKSNRDPPPPVGALGRPCAGLGCR
jgi:hypothetical protein